MNKSLIIIIHALTIMLFNQLIFADEVKLASGETITGELVKISRKGLIFEMRTETGVYNQTLAFDDVLMVVDQSGEILYQDRRALKYDLKQYFNQLPEHDFQGPVLKRAYFYPLILCEIGYTSVNSNLSQLSDPGGIVSSFEVADRYSALYLGLHVKIKSFISAGMITHITFNFGSGISDENDSDTYLLNLFEIRFYLPLEFGQLWCGISLAGQSITLFPSQSFKWKVTSYSPGFALGIHLPMADAVGVYAAGRYIPFARKPMSDSNSTNVDLSSLTLNAGLQIVF